jgi:hypothetical protein
MITKYSEINNKFYRLLELNQLDEPSNIFKLVIGGDGKNTKDFITNELYLNAINIEHVSKDNSFIDVLFEIDSKNKELLKLFRTNLTLLYRLMSKKIADSSEYIFEKKFSMNEIKDAFNVHKIHEIDNNDRSISTILLRIYTKNIRGGNKILDTIIKENGKRKYNKNFYNVEKFCDNLVEKKILSTLLYDHIVINVDDNNALLSIRLVIVPLELDIEIKTSTDEKDSKKEIDKEQQEQENFKKITPEKNIKKQIEELDINDDNFFNITDEDFMN